MVTLTNSDSALTQYISLWKHTGLGRTTPLICEQEPIYGLKAAIHDYWQNLDDLTEYSHTLALKSDGTYEIVDLEAHIELEAELEVAEADDWAEVMRQAEADFYATRI